MNMDDLLRDIYGEGAEAEILAFGGGCTNEADMYPGMTLEDFLARAGVGTEEEAAAAAAAAQGVAVVPAQLDGAAVMAVGMGPGMADPYSAQQQAGEAFLGIGNGARGRRRPMNETVHKAVLQRQKRMIKNRESAARSRERKQAHTVELESLAAQLEEENMRLKEEKETQERNRLKELIETRIPVTRRNKQPRQLRRTFSMLW